MFPDNNVDVPGPDRLTTARHDERIDLPHLVWALESARAAGQVVNQITVDDDTAHCAKVALDRDAGALTLPGP
ncbi:hypothetical protein GCM10017559_00930 [Streptosporangium longisporum]|uniref:Uncharacterized protein n=1 Tax=Streptosporangium longisporum TaxID=46187 RepID=A0ABN3XPH4_9ACTN